MLGGFVDKLRGMVCFFAVFLTQRTLSTNTLFPNYDPEDEASLQVLASLWSPGSLERNSEIL